MKLLVMLLATTAFLMIGRTVLAEEVDHTAGAGTSEAKAPPPMEDAGMQQDISNQVFSATSTATPDWQMGASSQTYVENSVFNPPLIQALTMDQVGYYGTNDGSYPRVGDTYYGVITAAAVNSFGAKVVPEVKLPPNTEFNIDPSNPNKMVYCWYRDVTTNQFTQITGADCAQTPKPGLAGTGFWQFGGPQSTNWLWPVPGGKELQIIFPLKSTAPLKGLASTGDCLIGAVWADAAIGNWDKPDPWDHCPLPTDHGPYAWVNVSPNAAPTISALKPTPGSTTHDTTPLISAVVRDDHTDLAKSNIKLYVDGKQKTTFSYSAATDKFSYLSGKLSYAKHTVKMVARDEQGLIRTRSWSFAVVR